MLKTALITLAAAGILVTGVALAESHGSFGDDDDHGSGYCAEASSQGDQDRRGYDDECEDDGDDDDDDDGRAMSGGAPAGSAPPPDNGLLTPGSIPQVSVQ